MKIIYDHQIFSRQKYGGISRYFHEIASRIATLSQNHTEIFSPLYVNQYQSQLLKRGLQVNKFRGSSLALGMVNTIAGTILVRGRKDITIFHETYYSRASYAPPTAKRVITVYDMIHELFPDSFSKADATRSIKRRAIQRADHIICISESTRKDLIRLLNVPIEKTSVIYLGHSLTRAYKAGLETPDVHKPYLLYVGNRGGYKNFKSLLLAYSELTSLRGEVSLVCFGGGAFSLEELSEMKRLNLDLNDIKYTSGGDEILSNLYSSATALIYPSLYEGFGIPPLEAMAHGCPVICSNTSSLPEVVGSAAELFDPHDPGCLGVAIENVVSSPSASGRLIALGYERVQNFSWDKCARTTLDQYLRILEN